MSAARAGGAANAITSAAPIIDLKMILPPLEIASIKNK
jgi:hypothetical protein